MLVSGAVLTLHFSVRKVNTKETRVKKELFEIPVTKVANDCNLNVFKFLLLGKPVYEQSQSEVECWLLEKNVIQYEKTQKMYLKLQ
jgi:hypothetical protein